MYDPLSDEYEYVLPELHKWLLDHGVKSELKTHHMYREWQSLSDELKEKLPIMKNLQSKDQIIAEGSFGKISVIQGGCSFGLIEIYCIEGDIFSEIKRYKTVEDAGKTIVSLLNTGLFDESVKRMFDVWSDWLSSDPEGSIQDVDTSEIDEMRERLEDEEGEEWKKGTE